MTFPPWLTGVVTLLHYWLPVAIGWSLALVMGRWTGQPLAIAGMLLLLSGIGAAYSVDRLLDPPAKPRQPRWVIMTLALGCVIFIGIGIGATTRMQGSEALVAVILAIASLCYARLKRYPLAKTAIVALVWSWALAVFPLAGGAAMAWDWWKLPVFPPLFLLLVAGCLLSDLKDAGEDRRRTIPTLPALFGSRATCVIAALFALTGAGMAASYGDLTLLVTGCAIALIAGFPAFLSQNRLGPMVIDALFLIPGILIVSGLV